MKNACHQTASRNGCSVNRRDPSTFPGARTPPQRLGGGVFRRAGWNASAARAIQQSRKFRGSLTRREPWPRSTDERGAEFAIFKLCGPPLQIPLLRQSNTIGLTPPHLGRAQCSLGCLPISARSSAIVPLRLARAYSRTARGFRPRSPVGMIRLCVKTYLAEHREAERESDSWVTRKQSSRRATCR